LAHHALQFRAFFTEPVALFPKEAERSLPEGKILLPAHQRRAQSMVVAKKGSIALKGAIAIDAPTRREQLGQIPASILGDQGEFISSCHFHDSISNRCPVPHSRIHPDETCLGSIEEKLFTPVSGKNGRISCEKIQRQFMDIPTPGICLFVDFSDYPFELQGHKEIV
jgi:hypothetical protein